MRHIHLAPDYRLPGGVEYDVAIEAFDQAVRENGGPSWYLGVLRGSHASSQAFFQRVTVPLTDQAFDFEAVDRQKMPLTSGMWMECPPKGDLAISRAVLSGMMFGHFVQEPLYPRMYEADPYVNPTPANLRYMDEAQLSHYAEVKGTHPVMAHRLATQAMSLLILRNLSEASLQRVEKWGVEMVGVERQPLFMHGFGTAMYLAWDAYSDFLIDDDRADEIHSFTSMVDQSL